jgi:hypothetical protein
MMLTPGWSLTVVEDRFEMLAALLRLLVDEGREEGQEQKSRSEMRWKEKRLAM